MTRIIPIELVQHKQGRFHTTCWCTAIVPREGPAEGYTSLDTSLDLPGYTSLPGDDLSTFSLPAISSWVLPAT